jgi:hypothetical protein
MVGLPERLAEHGFKVSHEIKNVDGTVRFERLAHAAQESKPCVYAWFSTDSMAESAVDFLYVGKAGSGVAERMRQHQGGFVHSSTGRDNARRLKEILESGKRAFVCYRNSATATIFGIETPLYSSEEAALYALLRPRINRAVLKTGANQVGMTPLGRANSLDLASQGADSTPEEATQQHALLRRVGSLPNHEEVVEFFMSLPGERRELFLRLLDAISRRFPEKEPRYIGGYTSLPKGYNGKGLINFADYGEKGVARADSWVARIVLTDEDDAPLTVILPDPPTKHFDYHEANAPKGTKSFAVSDIEAFLRAVGYLAGENT